MTYCLSYDVLPVSLIFIYYDKNLVFTLEVNRLNHLRIKGKLKYEDEDALSCIEDGK